jgi:hypothetical protein
LFIVLIGIYAFYTFQTLEDVQKSEFIKKGIEVTGEFGKTVGKAGESVLEQGKKLGESSTVKTVSKVSIL